MSPASLGQTFLVLSLATLALFQEYLITPKNQFSCHTNTTCFTVDQLAQNNLINGANLTFIFQPGEHTLTRLLSIRNFTHVQMIGHLTPVLTLHDRGWIELSNIDQLNIENLTFTGEKLYVMTSQFLSVSDTNDTSINKCSFTGLRAYAGSIFNFISIVKVVIVDVLFGDNIGTALRISDAGTVSIKKSKFTGNRGRDGAAALSVVHGRITITDSVFTNNIASGFRGEGGAISVDSGRLTISHSVLKGNNAMYGGGIRISSGNLFITHSVLAHNTAYRRCGGIFIKGSASAYITQSTLTHNRASWAGGICANYFGNISITHTALKSNTATELAGGIFVSRGSLSITHSTLTSNNARRFAGGGIVVISGSMSITQSTLTGNTAAFYGGGIHVKSGSTSVIMHSTLTGNSASDGSAIYTTRSSSLEIISVSILSNVNDSIYIYQSSLTFRGNNTIRNNTGPIYAYNSQVYFNGPIKMENNNHGTSGGAIEAIQSTIYFSSELTISNNTAEKYGGGVFLRESSLFVNSPVIISHNTAREGGAIYAYQSTIEFNNTGSGSMIANNVAHNGGGVHVTASVTKLFRSFVYVVSNTAEVNGGGFYLQQNSKVYIQKQEPEYDDSDLEVNLTISNNKALFGGGMYVNDSTSGGGACNSRATETDFVGECFIQTIKLHNFNFDNTVNTFITHNIAKYSGSAIYGGLLDRCTVSQSAELTDISNGLEYVNGTVELPGGKHSISSDPLQVKLCNSSPSNVMTKKGHTFRVSIKALDQVGSPMNATIHGAVVSKSGVGRLKEGQVTQRVGKECTELEYNVFSEDSSAQLELYAIGPCSNQGISKLTIMVMFLNCTCPLGFHQSQSNIECSCECDLELNAIKCFPEGETFQPDSMLWIGAANFTDCNDTGYLVQDCPFDYCIDHPVNISLNSSLQINRQCAYNRSGVLCGECEEGLSLVFATSSCEKCSNIYLFLLIPFAVAGIVLVAFILCLNITIATGTIYGMILYANVLAANKAIFLPFPAPNFLTVFVAWVNLDLGIETCFFDGMNSQAKVLLQLAFPAYLFLLIFLIIILSRYSNSFATLLSNRNPVAALCTLLILTYSKLLRMIIATLQFTTLKCPDDSVGIVWLYNANVLYFSPSHIPRFVTAAIILTACVLFTTLLFFGQWFPRCSKWKVMKWTKNTKYIGFMDAFHAPFTPKHRYWPGLLLFALIVHNLVASMATNTLLPVLSAGCIAVGLNVYKSVMNRVYKNRLNNVLENLFLLNVAILALGTFTASNNSDRQRELAYVSMALAFLLFLVITFFHFYKYVLKKTNVLNKKQLRPLKRKNNDLKLRKPKKNVVIELQEVAEVYSYEQRPREETNPDKYITPPIIRPATKPDQLREPALDILAPVTTEDYRQAPPAIEAENRPRPVVTSTIVEIS